MKFSVITPEHSESNQPYLIELYQSLLHQKYKQWEWILYLNNGMTKDKIPEFILNDENVLIFEDSRPRSNIGEIKNRAFHLATGDILVELDHDDMLLPDCLEKLHEAFQDSKIGFVYSNSVILHMNDEFVPHSEKYGWTYRTCTFREKTRISMNHFPPTSHSMAYVWYAPDHVRAWRRDVYREIGGHNPDLSVCDDHELCIRTYLSTEMRLIEDPLYVYRITGDNTWLERNAFIQQQTRMNFNNWIRKLAEHDSKKRGLRNIDLGGGLNPYEDYETVDTRHTANHVCDLNDGIPLEDNSCGVVNASHILEHLNKPIDIMHEIHRVLAPGGWAFIEVPSTDGRGAFQDPTHVTFWNENSFLYYTREEQAKFIDNKKIRFQEYRLDTYFPNDFHRERNIPITVAVLVAIKDGCPRYPGPLLI